MTPFELEILFHYYVTPTEHRAVRENVPIWPKTRQWFLEQELLKLPVVPSTYGASYEVGERGMELINHILNLPLPQKKWVMP